MHALALSLLGWALWTTAPTAPGPAKIEPATTEGSTQIEAYLSAQGLDLLRQREAMESNPAQSASACQNWWQQHSKRATLPNKERVLALWALVDPSACAKAMGQVLHQHWQAQPTDSYIDCERNESYEQRLCQSLRRLEQAAAPEFLRIAADPKVPESGRAIALEQIAAQAPASWLLDIAKQGLKRPSNPALREPLSRALQARGHADQKARIILVQDLKRTLSEDQLEATLAMRLWGLLGQLSPSLDPKMYQVLAKRLLNPALLVPQRVVYAQILAKAPAAKASLDQALDQLYAATTGPSATSIVLTQALMALPLDRRRAFLDHHPTWHAGDPALASLSWADASLPANPKLRNALLRAGLASIWPQVQSAALSRLEPKCHHKNLRRAAALAGPQSRNGSPDQSVRRAAIDALARCSGRYTARKLRQYADNDALGAYDRGRALRRLVEISPQDPRTQKRIVTIIRRAPNELGRSALFLSLGQLAAPPDYIVQEMCKWAGSQQPRIQRTSAKKAKSALRRLNRRCPGTP